MNILDVAAKAGVSKATVSKYLNGTGYVSDAAAARIRAAIEESGYRPNPLARALSCGESLKLVGLICYDIADLYYAQCAAAIESRLRAAGFEMVLACTGRSTDTFDAAVESLLRKNVDALLFIGAVFAGQAERILAAAGRVPCFLLNIDLDGENIFCCYCDDGAAVRSAAQTLKESGRQNPLYLYGAKTCSAEQKMRGFSQVFAEKERLVCGGTSFGQHVSRCEEILQKYRPDALLCADDMLAAAALKAAQKLGLRVPEDLAVVGHNDCFLTRTCTPTLSSIDSRGEFLAQTTAENLVRFFEGKPFEKKVRANWKLVRRESF